MVKSFGNGDERLGQYCADLFKPIGEIQQRTLDHCKANSLPPIWINAMDGQHLAVLARLATQGNTVGAKILEIGTLGGYSAICMALATSQNTQIITLEMNLKSAKVAQENIASAGFSDRIQVKVGKALETLSTMENEDAFDLIFIDADKSSYLEYGHWALKNLRMGGLLVADNTFAWGLVLQKNIDDPDKAMAANGIKAFNEFVATDSRWMATLFPTGEGLTVAVKVSA
jgi:caffeoyl-CoA O-methyltransferase